LTSWSVLPIDVEQEPIIEDQDKHSLVVPMFSSVLLLVIVVQFIYLVEQQNHIDELGPMKIVTNLDTEDFGRKMKNVIIAAD
jgi:hypothetical protein